MSNEIVESLVTRFGILSQASHLASDGHLLYTFTMTVSHDCLDFLGGGDLPEFVMMLVDHCISYLHTCSDTP